jgi:hypothetical protein
MNGASSTPEVMSPYWFSRSSLTGNMLFTHVAVFLKDRVPPATPYGPFHGKPPRNNSVAARGVPNGSLKDLAAIAPLEWVL